MTAERRGPSLKVRVLRLLESWTGPCPLRAFSVAFPIRKVVYSVTERQPIEMGLVEKYVVEAAQRFGPLTHDELADLLGHDLVLLRRIVQGLSGEHGALTVSGNVVAAAPETALAPHTVLTHDRAFAVAGFGGALLPVDAAEVLSASRLAGNVMRDEFVTAGGAALNLRGGFTHHPHHSGIEDLRTLVDAGPDVGEKYGLPLGLVAIGDRRPEQEENYWVEAIVFFGEDTCWIRPAALMTLDLVRSPDNRPDVVCSACEGLSQFGRADAASRADAANRARLLNEISAALPGFTPAQAPTETSITLRHSERPRGLAPFLEVTGSAHFTELLRARLWWHQATGSIITPLIGDAGAASIAAALRLHSAIKRNAASVTKAPESAWAQIVDSVRSSCAPGVAADDLHLHDAIAALRPVSDSALQRALDAIEDARGDKA